MLHYLSDIRHLTLNGQQFIKKMKADHFLTLKKLKAMKTGEKWMLGCIGGPDTPFNLVKLVSNLAVEAGYAEAFIEKTKGGYKFVGCWACDYEVNSQRKLIRKQIYTAGHFKIKKESIVLSDVTEAFSQDNFYLINRFFHFIDKYKLSEDEVSWRGVLIKANGMTEDNRTAPPTYTEKVIQWMRDFDFDTNWKVELPIGWVAANLK